MVVLAGGRFGGGVCLWCEWTCVGVCSDCYCIAVAKCERMLEFQVSDLSHEFKMYQSCAESRADLNDDDEVTSSSAAHPLNTSEHPIHLDHSNCSRVETPHHLKSQTAAAPHIMSSLRPATRVLRNLQRPAFLQNSVRTYASKNGDIGPSEYSLARSSLASGYLLFTLTSTCAQLLVSIHKLTLHTT